MCAKNWVKHRLGLGPLAVVGMALLINFGCLPSAHAELQGRDLDGQSANGFEAFYDTELNISWLADASYPATLKLGAAAVDANKPWDSTTNVTLRWDEAVAFVNNLNVAGVTGWRLPSRTAGVGSVCSPVPGLGYCINHVANLQDSELAHLFYVTLGNGGVAGDNLNDGPFKNLVHNVYWTGQDEGGSVLAWYVSMATGGETFYFKNAGGMFVLPVHDGDVGVLAVPEPQTIHLLIFGLLGLYLARRLNLTKSQKR